MKKIGFVTSWYGENISGGAETELRGIVTHLQEAGVELEVLTTCVKDFAGDWNVDYYKEGAYDVQGICVRRFPVRKRDTLAFDAVNYKFMNNLAVTREEEETFMREMVNSPKLYEYMKEHQEEYALYVFIPYMFGPTYYGIQVCPEKAVLISCFHDESYVYMDIFKEVFSKLKGIIFLAKPEQELANRVFDLSNVNQGMLGAGVDSVYEGHAEDFVKKYKIDSPFILYAGRKDEGKNVHTLIRYFMEYKKRNVSDMKLVLIGGGNIDIPKEGKNDILDLGYVPIQDKFDAYAAAKLLCQPSKNESFSLVIMESWLCSRPVLVHENCAVTKNFAIEAKGGLFFKDYYDFEGCVNYYLEHEEIADKMGENGREYVRENFLWDVMVKKLTDFFKQCAENE